MHVSRVLLAVELGELGDEANTVGEKRVLCVFIRFLIFLLDI